MWAPWLHELACAAGSMTPPPARELGSPWQGGTRASSLSVSAPTDTSSRPYTSLSPVCLRDCKQGHGQETLFMIIPVPSLTATPAGPQQLLCLVVCPFLSPGSSPADAPGCPVMEGLCARRRLDLSQGQPLDHHLPYPH